MIAIIAAPSNLGLRPPVPGGVPGAGKAPEALREAGRAPLVLGGDCSVLLGAALATAHHHTGLVHIDGHTDLRHPGTSQACGSVAGEDLAAAIGLHWDALANIDGLAPYIEPSRAVHLGHRVDDEHLAEARQRLGLVASAEDVTRRSPGALATQALAVAGAGCWLHVDLDVLDAAVMPAVDSPEPEGLEAGARVALLRALAPHAAGATVTAFDPDLDPTGEHARLVADVIVEGLGELGMARGE